MKRFLARATVACQLSLALSLAYGQHIDAEAYLVTNGELLEVAGQAQFFDADGDPSIVGMSGNLALFYYPLGTTAEMYLNYVWGTDNGAWSGSYNQTGDAGVCYYSAINARVIWWTDGSTTEREASSGTYCVPAPPPSPPYRDVADDGSGDCSQSADPETCQTSPIILALGDQNYRLTSLADGVRFDLRNEGTRRQVAWTVAGVENAFLAIDRNNNGQIDNGSELFGNHTPLRFGERAPHGFAALADIDDNGDGILDVRDTAWFTLLLWNDRDHNGESSPDELQALSNSGVVALETAHRTIGKKDRWGNSFRYISTFHLSKNGVVYQRNYYDIFLLMQP